MSSHSWLTYRYSHPSLELSTSIAWFDVVRLGDDDVLTRIEVSSAVTAVLCLLDGCLLVALVKAGDDICI